MRVLVAPGRFAGSPVLAAGEVAAAYAEGWRRHAPDDVLDLAPMAGGGAGFVDVLHEALGGELLLVNVDGRPATLLDADGTVYVELAQVSDTISVAAGHLLGRALATGARRVVVAAGDTAWLDGGAGLLAALGATASGGSLTDGSAGLAGLEAVDLGPAREVVGGTELVLAADADAPLAGLFGAARTQGPGLGVPEAELPAVDLALQRLGEVTDRALATRPGAGAAGGVGFALLLLGAAYRPALELVCGALGLEARARAADLVVTGEASLDFSGRGGRLPAVVARAAATAARPCVVLAERVALGSRELRALGFEAAYAADTLADDPHRPEALADLAARVARTWSR